MFVDSHCHIHFEGLRERMPEVLDHMRAAQVSHALCVSVDLETLPQLLALAEEHATIYASVGVHPDHGEGAEPSAAQLVELARHDKVVAIGETGLDYYRLGERALDDMEAQQTRFRTHIRAARACAKPLIIHTRAAAEDTLRIMQNEEAAEVGGVMHCFTETWDVAERALELGFHISLSGIVTFKNATQVREVVRRVPLERLLIETDSPYLAPVPYRGKQNEPAFVRYVGRCVAELRGMPVEALAAATTANFFRLFAAARVPGGAYHA